jgi:hypothetical protein
MHASPAASRAATAPESASSHVRVAEYSASVAFYLTLISALGCGGDEGTRSDSLPSEGSIVLRDANNYRASSQLSIPTIETASGMDLDICWNDVVSDLQCHALLPMQDVDNVGLLRFLNLTEEQVERRLTSGQLTMSEIDGYLEYNTDHQSTCAKLSSMSFFGTEIDISEEYTESATNTYMLVFAEGTTPGVGARSMTFLEPTVNSNNLTVNAGTGCGLLEFSADLDSAERVAIPSEGPWLIDWRNVTQDGQGNPIVPEGIDGVLLGFYEGKSVPELQEQILDLELIATDIWEINLTGGRTANLGLSVGRDDGAPFSGFDPSREGVWLLGLTCSTCQNPAPVVLTILDPGAGAP